MEKESQLEGTRFFVSDFLEREVTEAEQLLGLDPLDYLIQQDWRKFRNDTSEKNESKQIEQLRKAIRETKSQTVEIWRKIRLVRKEIRNHEIRTDKARTNRELLKKFRGLDNNTT